MGAFQGWQQHPGPQPRGAPAQLPMGIRGRHRFCFCQGSGNFGGGHGLANFARRTGHPREDLEQLAAIGLIKASIRYDDKRINNSKSNFIAYARPFVNGEINHYLRDKGFLISVPGRWRELHARGQKLIREVTRKDLIPELLGLTAIRWAEIVEACAVRVIAMNQIAEEEDL